MSLQTQHGAAVSQIVPEDSSSLAKGEFNPLLASVSRSFYLSLRFLPEPLREPLGLAYLLARASDTIADAAAAPQSQRLLALDALSDALEQGTDSRALAEALASLPCPKPSEATLLLKAPALLRCYNALKPSLRSEIHAVLRIIIGGQRGDLVRFGYASASAIQSLSSASQTEEYTYAVAGCVGEFWTRLCALETPWFARLPVTELLNLGRRFGQGLQMVNILRDLPEDLRMGRCYLPSLELEANNLSPSDLLTDPRRARPLVEHWMAQAESWLAAGEAYVQGIRGRSLRFSVALPRLLGQETLSLLRQFPPLETGYRVRVTRATVLRCAWVALRE